MPQGRPIETYQKLLIIKLKIDYCLPNAVVAERTGLSMTTVCGVIREWREESND